MDCTRTGHKNRINGKFTENKRRYCGRARAEAWACCSKDVASTSDSCSFSAGASTLSDGRDSDIDSEEGKDQERRRVVSLLDRLKAPSAADISRPRKTKKNEPPHGKRQCKGAVSSDPKGVSPQQRVREFGNESLTVSHGHLFCSACRELCFNITRDDLLTKALMY